MPAKELKFSFAVDTASAAAVKNILRELTAEAERFAKVLQGAQFPGGRGSSPFFGGGNVGTPPTGQQTIGQGAARSPIANMAVEGAQAFRNLGSSARDSLQTLSGTFRSFVTEQMRLIDSLDSRLAGLAGRYRALGGAGPGGGAPVGGAPPAGFAALPSGLLVPSGMAGGAAAAAGAPAAQLATANAVAAAPAGAGGGMGGALGGFLGRFAGPAAVGATLASLPAAGLDIMQTGRFFDITQQARGGRAIGQLGVQMRHGDISSIAAVRAVMQDPNLANQLLTVGADAGFWRQGAEGLRGVISNIFSPAKLPNEVGKIVAGLPATQKEELRKFIDLSREAMPGVVDQMEMIAGRSDSDMGTMRLLGMGEERLHRFFMKMSQPVNDIGKTRSVITRENIMQAAGMTRGAFGRGGGIGVGLMGVLGGFDVSGLVRFTAAGGRAREAIETIGGATRTGVAAERLGAPLSALMRGQSVAGGEAEAAMLTAVGFGRGAAQDILTAQYREPAVQAFNAVVRGQNDPLGAGIGVLAAEQVLGPGSSVAARNYLSQLPTAILQRALRDPTARIPELEAYGISTSQVRAWYDQKSRSEDRARSAGLFAGGDPTSMAFRRIQALGGGLTGRQAFFREARGAGAQARAVDTLAAIQMAETPLSTPDFMTARGFVETQLGLGARGRRRGFGDVAFGSVAAAAAGGRGRAEEAALLEAVDSKTAGPLKAIFATVDVFSRGMIKLADPSAGVEAVANMFGALAKETDVLIDKFRQLAAPDKISPEEREAMRKREAAALKTINDIRNIKTGTPAPSRPDANRETIGHAQ